MLFSQSQVAEFINANFEPTWQPVRPVPIVRIDFGNGNVITRTLHGNIATYVCTAEGQVLDIMPGIYEPKTYVDQLGQFVALHRWSTADPSKLDAVINAYHRKQAELLAAGEPPHRIVRRLDRTKRAIEAAARFALAPAEADAGTSASGPVHSTANVELPKVETSATDLAGWDALAEDTRVNESTRRQIIHERLANAGPIQPADITKWLYREVLHADLDDPYLGLGEALFANYPFRAEDEN